MADSERTRAQRPGLPFVKVPTTVVRDSGLSVVARLLYSVIASYADLTTLQATILRGTLAEDIGRSRDTLDRAVTELVKAGLLRVEHRRNDVGVPISSQYTLIPPADASPQVSDGRTSAAIPMGTDAAMGMGAAMGGRMDAAMGTGAAKGYGHPRGDGMGTGAAGVAAPVRHITRTKERESVNETTPPLADVLDLGVSAPDGAVDGSRKPPKPSREDLERDADEFYAAYPLKKSPADAKKAYLKARTRATHAELMAGIAAYKAELARTGVSCKYPATWLNADCWKDEPAPTTNRPAPPGIRQQTYLTDPDADFLGSKYGGKRP